MKHREEPYEYSLNIRNRAVANEIKEMLSKKKERDIHFHYKEMESEQPWAPWVESRLHNLDCLVQNIFDEMMNIRYDEGEPYQVNRFATAKDFAELKERFDILLMELQHMGFGVTGHDRDFYWECRKRDEKESRKTHAPEFKRISNGGEGDGE